LVKKVPAEYLRHLSDMCIPGLFRLGVGAHEHRHQQFDDGFLDSAATAISPLQAQHTQIFGSRFVLFLRWWMHSVMNSLSFISNCRCGLTS